MGAAQAETKTVLHRNKKSMRYTLGNILSGFRTPVGKIQLAHGIRRALSDTSALLRTPVGRGQFMRGGA